MVHQALLFCYAIALASMLRVNGFKVEPNGVSISGISSGADMAVQMQVAYSSTICGAGIFAGQAWHCAVHRFPGEALIKGHDPSVPYCDDCPVGFHLGYDHCKRNSNVTHNIQGLVEFARNQSESGTIDDLRNLADRRIFLYRGKSDHTYNKGSVNTTANFFREFTNGDNVYFENRVNSSHLLPGINPYLCWWEEWAGLQLFNCSISVTQIIFNACCAVTLLHVEKYRCRQLHL